MKIEFDSDEVKGIILAEAQKYDPKLNTVTFDGYSHRSHATVTYVDPVEAAADKARVDAYLASLPMAEAA